jgi:putative ABC transport system permease protein
VLLFTLGVSGLASLLFGLAPALHTCTQDLAHSLREAGRGLAGGARQGLLRKGLVISEVALSLVLLVAASLMIRTFLTLQDVQLGFHPDHLLTMRVPLADQRYSDPDRRIAFFRDLLGRLKALPGVTAVGLNTSVHPMENWNVPVEVKGAAQEDQRPVELHQVNADYTRAFGIGLIEGRYLSDDDIAGKRRVAMVNESFVRDRLGGRLAVGRIFRLPEIRGDSRNSTEDAFEIVGVVKDTARQNLNGPVAREIYIPFTVLARADRVVVLASAGPSMLTRAMAAQVYAIDKNQPVTGLETLQAVLDDSIYAGPRFNLALFSLFAGLGLTLALVGVYGVIANSVTQQTREIGVRIAIGANGYQIVGMVVKRGLWLLLAGIVLGLLGGIFAARLIAGHISSVAAFDPISFGIVALILLATGLLACLLPAVRAARVDPMEALRTD